MSYSTTWAEDTVVETCANVYLCDASNQSQVVLNFSLLAHPPACVAIPDWIDGWVHCVRLESVASTRIIENCPCGRPFTGQRLVHRFDRSIAVAVDRKTGTVDVPRTTILLLEHTLGETEDAKNYESVSKKLAHFVALDREARAAPKKDAVETVAPAVSILRQRVSVRRERDWKRLYERLIWLADHGQEQFRENETKVPIEDTSPFPDTAQLGRWSIAPESRSHVIQRARAEGLTVRQNDASLVCISWA